MQGKSIERLPEILLVYHRIPEFYFQPVPEEEFGVQENDEMKDLSW
jgi:hypothetical protein